MHGSWISKQPAKSLQKDNIMNYDLKEIMNKYNKWGAPGNVVDFSGNESEKCPTDEELLFLISEVKHAVDLSEILNAGTACTFYFQEFEASVLRVLQRVRF